MGCCDLIADSTTNFTHVASRLSTFFSLKVGFKKGTLDKCKPSHSYNSNIYYVYDFSSICTTTSVLVTAFATIATITSLIGALDALTVFCGSLFQVEAESCSLAFIFGRILQPFVWFFGVDWSESDMVSSYVHAYMIQLGIVCEKRNLGPFFVCSIQALMISEFGGPGLVRVTLEKSIG